MTIAIDANRLFAAIQADDAIGRGGKCSDQQAVIATGI